MIRSFGAVGQILLLQLFAIGLTSSVALAASGWFGAFSAVLGGFAAFVPNLYLAFQVSRDAGSRAPAQIVRSLYVGEAVKLLSTALLLFYALQIPEIQFPALFAGLVSVLVVFWFALLLR